MKVSIISYGLGNLGSVANMLKRAGAEPVLVSTPHDVLASDRVLLPGIGAFDEGMSRLAALDLVSPLQEFAASGRPLFGVCLGMQLLCERSEEGDTECLGVIPAPVRHFAEAPGLRVPHMGWNRLRVTTTHPLVADLRDGDSAYFVHSYAVPTGAWTIAESDHGGAFAAIVAHGNFMGMQFHPERSADVGARLLRNFLLS